MMNSKTRTGLGVAVVLAFVAGVAVSELLEVPKVGAAPKESYEGIETFTNILSIIQKNYVDEVPTKELQVETKGSFGGLGIEITNKSGMLTVVAPIEDTPAYRAGIKSGDVILK